MKSVTQETLHSKTISIEILPPNLRGLFCNKRGKSYLLCVNLLSVLHISFQKLGSGRDYSREALPGRRNRIIIFSMQCIHDGFKFNRGGGSSLSLKVTLAVPAVLFWVKIVCLYNILLLGNIDLEWGRDSGFYKSIRWRA